MVELDKAHEDVVDLKSELASRGHHDCKYVTTFCRFIEAHELLDEGNKEGERLSAAGDSLEGRFSELGWLRGIDSIDMPHTSTTTSLFPRNCGIQAACTGVMR